MADIPDFTYILFDNICDIIGPSEEWPEGILKLFWTRNLKHGVDLFYAVSLLSMD